MKTVFICQTRKDYSCSFFSRCACWKIWPKFGDIFNELFGSTVYYLEFKIWRRFRQISNHYWFNDFFLPKNWVLLNNNVRKRPFFCHQAIEVKFLSLIGTNQFFNSSFLLVFKSKSLALLFQSCHWKTSQTSQNVTYVTYVANATKS